MVQDPRIRILHPMPLRQPVLIAAWPGMGLVGFNAVEFLRAALGAEQVAEIEPADFFAVAGVQVKDGLTVPLKVPHNTFHGWRNPASGKDVLLFLGSAQPVSGREMTLSMLVLEVARTFGATQIFTAAAMAAQIDHLTPSRVFGVSSSAVEIGRLERLGVTMLPEGEIGGLNGLLIGVAQQQGMLGSCLMGEMPHYTTHIENPKASKAVLEVLSQLLSIPLDLSPLEERARYIETQIQGFLAAARTASESASASGETEESSASEDDEGQEPGSGGGKSGTGGVSVN
ncbi:MAG: PAC2 family protein [Candidatus Wallbacteria bacterium]|nr:PAC2 family protein [Candidatus Wallbacteria bacterium]